MPAWLMVTGRGNSQAVGDGETRYCTPCGNLYPVSDEIRVQFIARDTYTLANLLVKVITNDIDGTTTVRTRKNGANGNQSVNILTTETGTFQDTVNTDALVDGDLFNYQVVAGGASGSITFTIFSCTLETASNNTPIIGASYRTNLATGTKYAPLMGGGTLASTEVSSQYTFRVVATLSNFRLYGSCYHYEDTTVRIRVNGGNGNQSVLVPEDTAGVYEDAVNTDVIAVGDEVNVQEVVGVQTGGGASFDVYSWAVKSTSTGRQTAASEPVDAYKLFATQTRYSVLEDRSGDGYFATIEANAQCLTRMAFLGKNFFVNIPANAANGTRIVNTRINGGDGNLSVSIGAFGTGFFEDTGNTDTLIATDLYNYKIGAGGDAGLTHFAVVGFELREGELPAPPVVGLENKSANMGSKMVAAGLI